MNHNVATMTFITSHINPNISTISSDAFKQNATEHPVPSYNTSTATKTTLKSSNVGLQSALINVLPVISLTSAENEQSEIIPIVNMEEHIND